MLLTVHDELVFEVPESTVQAAAELVQDRMEHAVDLEVACKPMSVGARTGRRRAGRPLRRAEDGEPLRRFV
jgi:DNA polymerase I-like protein with 3'-5' exonuclease and polymerase domains